MEFFIWTFISGIVGGGISIGFRLLEIKKKSIYFWNQLGVQLIVFLLFLWGFGHFFSNYQITLPYNTHMSWFWIFFIVSNASYYMVKIGFETITGISFFPTEKEIEQYIKDNNLDQDI